MSAFLGPIHYQMYQKIQFQWDFIKNIADMIEKNGYDNTILSLMTKNCGTLEEGNLEDRIDKQNIHGWLQEKISVVEKGLAFLVTSLIAKNPQAIKEITETAYHFGENRKLTGQKNVGDAYKYLDSLLLNGMPCDKVISVLSQNENLLIWKQEREIHAVYWEAYKGDVRDYYAIRNHIILGILKDSGILYTQLGNNKYSLMKEE